MQALGKGSNERTYGHKWTIFLSYLVLALGYFIVNGILTYVGTDNACLEEMYYYVDGFTARSLCTATWASVLQFILMLLYIPFQLGILAEVYRNLVASNFISIRKRSSIIHGAFFLALKLTKYNKYIK